MSQKTYQRTKCFIQVVIVARTEVYDHGLSPLPMQNPYSELILGIKSLFVYRFSKSLLQILRQI